MLIKLKVEHIEWVNKFNNSTTIKLQFRCFERRNRRRRRRKNGRFCKESDSIWPTIMFSCQTRANTRHNWNAHAPITFEHKHKQINNQASTMYVFVYTLQTSDWKTNKCFFHCPYTINAYKYDDASTSFRLSNRFSFTWLFCHTFSVVYIVHTYRHLYGILIWFRLSVKVSWSFVVGLWVYIKRIPWKTRRNCCKKRHTERTQQQCQRSRMAS